MTIKSLLDTDFYKLTMMNAVFHQCPGTEVEYEFKCRNEAKWTPEIIEIIKEEIDNFCKLSFTEGDLEYLSTFSFFHKDFIDFLRLYKPNKKHVFLTFEKGKLSITIKGSWLLTILFEVPLLAIISEVYFMNTGYRSVRNSVKAKKLLDTKIKLATQSGFQFADFGTRRRIGREWQKSILTVLSKLPEGTFVGTSNIYFAKEFNLTPIGTQAHEWFMAFQGMNVKLVESQKKALQVWTDEYRGNLGIALTDTIGIDAFLKDFDLYFAKLYDGVRQDSGNPFDWGTKMLRHYSKLGIDAKTKTLVFSDGLDFDKMNEIYNFFKGFAKISFGVGTNLTNDFEDMTPLQLVVKMTKCNGYPVAKISDSPSKGMCKDKKFLQYLNKVYGEKI